MFAEKIPNYYARIILLTWFAWCACRSRWSIPPAMLRPFDGVELYSCLISTLLIGFQTNVWALRQRFFDHLRGAAIVTRPVFNRICQGQQCPPRRTIGNDGILCSMHEQHRHGFDGFAGARYILRHSG